MSEVPFRLTTAATGVPEQCSQPRSIVIAVRFICAGAGLQLLNIALTVASIGNATTNIMKSQPTDTASQAHLSAVQQVMFMAAGSLAAAALWLWMARRNAAGRSWARIVASLLFAIDTIVTPLVVISQGPGGSITSNCQDLWIKIF